MKTRDINTMIQSENRDLEVIQNFFHQNNIEAYIQKSFNDMKRI